MHPLEYPKELLGELHVETGTVISNEIDLFAILIRDAKLDACLGMLAGKLPSVPQQVLQGQAQKMGIALYGYPFLERQTPRRARAGPCGVLQQ